MQLQLQRTRRFAFTTEVLSGGGTLISTYFLSQIVDGPNVQGLHKYGGDYLAFAIIGYILATFMERRLAILVIFQMSVLYFHRMTLRN